MFKSIFGRESVDVSRAKQTKTLRIFNKDVTEVVRDQEYRVDFSVDGGVYSISVYLPPGYPEDRPLLQLTPPPPAHLRHPWLDASNQVVGAPGIVNYTKHCDLGQLVQNIVRELQVKLSAGASTASTSAGAASASASYPSGAFSTAGPSVPQAELDVPEVASLSRQQLEELLEDDDRVDELAESLPTLKPLLDELQVAMERVEKLAGETMSAAPTLSERQQSAAAARHALQTELSRFESNQRRHSQLAERYAPSHLAQLLEIGAAEAEEAGERLAEALAASQLTVDAFVKEFMQQRTLCYERRAKQERLQSQLRELDSTWAS